jgi:hypothetical protein
MHPYFLQSLAAERARDMRQQATTTRTARRARRGQAASPAGGRALRTGQRLAHAAARL